MATSKQKNTISNVFRYRSLEEENENPALYRKNEGGNIFNSKCLHTMVNETQPTIDLWHGLWHQGEMACLFGEPNVGKTILAMKIAADIVRRGESVLYFDFENAEHQLIPRYQGKEIPFIDILTFNYKNHYLKTDNHSLLDYIKRAALLRETHIIIIDDITHLFGIGSPADVRHVLNTLRSWTKHLRMSILVLAHSVKKRMNQIATIEQLAGSFECAYSFDSIFSLNRANDFNRRTRGISHYIKQHKTRMGAIKYDDRNTIALNMRFDDELQAFTMCDLAEGANERQLVRDYGFYTQEEILNAVIDYKEKFYSIREIAEMVGISKSQVQRLIAKNYIPHKPTHQDELKPLPPTSDESLNPYPISYYNYLDEEDALLYDDDEDKHIFYPPTYKECMQGVLENCQEEQEAQKDQDQQNSSSNEMSLPEKS